MPNAFIQKRRQKFMTKAYYEKMKEYYDDVTDYSIRDQNHYVDEFNFLSVDLQPDWIILFDVYYGQLLLAYTAGDDIKTLIPYLYKCIECKEMKPSPLPNTITRRVVCPVYLVLVLVLTKPYNLSA